MSAIAIATWFGSSWIAGYLARRKLRTVAQPTLSNEGSAPDAAPTNDDDCADPGIPAGRHGLLMDMDGQLLRDLGEIFNRKLTRFSDHFGCAFGTPEGQKIKSLLEPRVQKRFQEVTVGQVQEWLMKNQVHTQLEFMERLSHWLNIRERQREYAHVYLVSVSATYRLSLTDDPPDSFLYAYETAVANAIRDKFAAPEIDTSRASFLCGYSVNDVLAMIRARYPKEPSRPQVEKVVSDLFDLHDEDETYVFPKDRDAEMLKGSAARQHAMQTVWNLMSQA